MRRQRLASRRRPAKATFFFAQTRLGPPIARCSRLTVTDGPANRLSVKTPAAATGRSAATTTKSSVVSFTPTLAT